MIHCNVFVKFVLMKPVPLAIRRITTMLPFASDYTCPPHPAVMDAVVKAHTRRPSGSYGDDEITKQAAAMLMQHFEGAYAVLFVSSGTAANRLALQTLLPRPYSAVLCAA